MMRHLLLVAALAVTACSPAPPATSTANAPAPIARIEVLSERAESGFCTRDAEWCVKTAGSMEGGQFTTVTYTHDGVANDVAATLATDGLLHPPWQRIIRVSDGSVIVGITTRREDMYSGGGGFQTDVALYLVRPTDQPNRNDTKDAMAPVSPALPLSAEFSIRACFTPEDEAARRGACTDDYGFDADITLADPIFDNPPALVIITQATTYPGARSRSSDSTQAPPLGPNDLVTVRDTVCSYHRTLAWDTASGRYVLDQALPACEDYKTQ